jgi:hypothetical protein
LKIYRDHPENASPENKKEARRKGLKKKKAA